MHAKRGSSVNLEDLELLGGEGDQSVLYSMLFMPAPEHMTISVFMIKHAAFYSKLSLRSKAAVASETKQ